MTAQPAPFCVWLTGQCEHPDALVRDLALFATGDPSWPAHAALPGVRRYVQAVRSDRLTAALREAEAAWTAERAAERRGEPNAILATLGPRERYYVGSGIYALSHTLARHSADQVAIVGLAIAGHALGLLSDDEVADTRPEDVDVLAELMFSRVEAAAAELEGRRP